ncbi:FecR domain-containing protein [Carboxylicivirga sediminis]|uniref:FecR domain-containing protein n=1 Tax=Carboxylicivirga sediminis TaxID=2006564 RepID=A0A941F0A6_9BACT|nr:FecR domain-containing protein [Carboxylicivirga sediminis]MBR8534008.1 FecR domain-containing protein [Carboxylicivirga sediminis]
MDEQNKHIDELIVKYLAKDISAEEEQVLADWRQQSSDNAAYFTQMQKVWDNSCALVAFRSVDVGCDFEKFKTRVGMQSKLIKLSFKRKLMRFAAVMIPALVIIAAYTLHQSVPGFGKWEAFATDEEVDSIVLIDQSEVSLNKNSFLAYEKDFEGDARKLKLRGEAYFKVAKNPEKPFVVKVGNAEVKVLGTEFNIDENRRNNTITLSVTEGRVMFTSGSEKVEVSAGERAVLSNDKIVKSPLYSSNCIAWKTGTIIFEKASLDEVLETVVDHFSELHGFENKASKSDLFITTRFTNPSLEDVLVELRIHFKKKIEINDNKLVISD